jgi:menaquinone-dependent protoporphyrinogen oxidase
MTTSQSRRHFLKTGCVAAAAVGVTLCGGGALAAAYQPAIDWPIVTYGDQGASRRILIAYASKAGSTAETAARLGQSLSKLAVDVRPAATVTDLAPYQTVLLGSAIRMGQLLPEAMTFIKQHQAVLQQKSFSVFILCLTLKDNTAAARQTVSAYLDPVRALVKPASEGLFAGVMHLNKLKLFERLIMLAMQTSEGDYRQWDAINAWGEQAAAL